MKTQLIVSSLKTHVLVILGMILTTCTAPSKRQTYETFPFPEGCSSNHIKGYLSHPASFEDHHESLRCMFALESIKPEEGKTVLRIFKIPWGGIPMVLTFREEDHRLEIEERTGHFEPDRLLMGLLNKFAEGPKKTISHNTIKNSPIRVDLEKEWAQIEISTKIGYDKPGSLNKLLSTDTWRDLTTSEMDDAVVLHGVSYFVVWHKDNSSGALKIISPRKKAGSRDVLFLSVLEEMEHRFGMKNLGHP